MVNGFILINKKIGVTSRSVDNKIQRLFHTRKVGHLGTLDPFASGLLIIAIDKGCKALPYIDDSFKTYRAVLSLGKKTNTSDLTGEVIEEKEVPELYIEDILEVFEDLYGESEQIPPMTSAIHVDGKRLYELARKDIEVERKPRKIIIKSLKIVGFDGLNLEFEVICSKGTYVRTLGEDIASKLDTVGHLTFLRRLAIGDISLDKAIDIDELKETDLVNPIELISLKHLIVRDEKTIKEVKDGKEILLETEDDKVLLCYYDNNELSPLAVYERKVDNVYSSIRGLW